MIKRLCDEKIVKVTAPVTEQLLNEVFKKNKKIKKLIFFKSNFHLCDN